MNKKILKIFTNAVIILALLYVVTAFSIWKINNPLANDMTFYTHFNDMIHFRTLPEFQPRN